MKSLACILLMLGMLCSSLVVHAEGNCPQGYYPIGATGQPGPQGCAPMPGYNQGQAQPTQPQVRWASQWGAIAVDGAAGSVGVSKNMQSKADAENQARVNCESQGGKVCKVEVAYDNECGALVAGDTGHNSGADSTADKAVALGIKTCKEAGDTNCHVLYSDCSLPKQIQ